MPTGSSVGKFGYVHRVFEMPAPPQHVLRPNWWAIASLWLVVASWFTLALRISTDEILGFESPLDWLYLAAVVGGVLAGAVGLLAVRTRGSGWLAASAFFASLILPTVYAIYFLFWASVGGLDPGLD